MAHVTAFRSDRRIALPHLLLLCSHERFGLIPPLQTRREAEGHVAARVRCEGYIVMLSRRVEFLRATPSADRYTAATPTLPRGDA
jgi:hypothetical protein